MLRTETSASRSSTYLLPTAWRPRGLWLGSLNAHQLTRTCCLPCHLLSPYTTSLALPFGLPGTPRFMLIVLRQPRLDQSHCSLTSTLRHLPLLPRLEHWMTLA